MGRRFSVVLLLIAAVSGGAYYYWPEPQEQPVPDPQEEEIKTNVVVMPVSASVLVGSIAFAPGQGFPGSLPLAPLVDLGERGGYSLDVLLRTSPLKFLELCVERFDARVHGYTCTFVKKERIDGKLHPPGKNDYEIIKVACREQPFSVYFEWVKHRRLASRALYVEGENKNMILARPIIGWILQRPLDDPEAKRSGRYSMAQFGMGKAIQRVVESMQAAEQRGALHVRYLGEFKLAEVGDRICHKFVRTPYDPTEEDGLNELTIYIDKENWLQVGSILRDTHGNLLAEYFFRDVVINPTFPTDQFTRKAL